MEELGEGFFNEYTTDFYEYFDQHLVKNVVKKGEYKKISDEIKQIKKEYPNLVSLLEEQENVELSFKESSALNEIISLERELNIIDWNNYSFTNNYWNIKKNTYNKQVIIRNKK